MISSEALTSSQLAGRHVVTATTEDRRPGVEENSGQGRTKTGLCVCQEYLATVELCFGAVTLDLTC